jgi:hypothetical protein
MFNNKKVLTEEQKIENAVVAVDYRKLPMLKKIDFWLMVIKYWYSGDEWDFAKAYAMSVIKGFKRY